MSDLNSTLPPAQPSQRPVTPAPVTSGDSTAQGQTPRHSDGQPLPQEQQPTPNPAVTLSASLAGMSPGRVVDAVVLGTDADGVPVVRAAGGTFLVVAKDAPPPHAELVLKIQSTGHEVRALITSVNGEPQRPPTEIGLLLTNVSGGATGGAAAGPALETYSPPAGVARPAGPIQNPAQPLAPGQMLTAQIVPAPLAAAALLSGNLAASAPKQDAAAATTFRVGTPLLVRILNVGGNPTLAGPVAPAGTLGGSALGPTTPGAAIPGAAAAGTSPPGEALGVSKAAAAPGILPQAAGSQTAPAQVPGSGAAPEQRHPSAVPPAQVQGAGPQQSRSTTPGNTTPGGPAANSTSAAKGSTPDNPRNAANAAPPAHAGPAAPAAQHAVTLNGVVVEQTADGQTLVRTPAGTLQFEAALVVQAGTQVTMEVQPSPATEAPSPGGSPSLAASPGAVPAAASPAAPVSPQAVLADFSTGWSALRELVQAVQVADPGIARQFSNQRLPSNNSRATNNILFFLSALRGGDVQGWLGADMTRAAERAGQRRLIDRLGDDFAQLRTLINSDDDAEWRAAPFPFLDGNEIEAVNMFVRGRRPEKGDGEEDVRFVVQFDLSALGEIQLDGLLRQQNFDLIVRSHTGLSEQVRQGIGTLFNSAIEATGMTGNIVFQNVATFPVSPFNDLFGVEHPAGSVVA